MRDRLGLREGDRVVFQFDENGNLLLRQEAQSPLGRLPGLLKHLAKDRPVTLEEMKAAVKQGAARKFHEKRKAMIALDTNILVRLITQDDPQQAALAERLVQQATEEGEVCFVSDVVLCEAPVGARKLLRGHTIGPADRDPRACQPRGFRLRGFERSALGDQPLPKEQSGARRTDRRQGPCKGRQDNLHLGSRTFPS